MTPFRHYKKLTSAKAFLDLDQDGRPTSQRLNVCVVALLWEMACVDGPLNQQEFVEIIKEMDRDFHLMHYESAELIEIVELLAREGCQLNDFIRDVNENFDLEQREHLYDLIMAVAEVDGITKGS